MAIRTISPLPPLLDIDAFLQDPRRSAFYSRIITRTHEYFMLPVESLRQLKNTIRQPDSPNRKSQFNQLRLLAKLQEYKP